MGSPFVSESSNTSSTSVKNLWRGTALGEFTSPPRPYRHTHTQPGYSDDVRIFIRSDKSFMSLKGEPRNPHRSPSVSHSIYYFFKSWLTGLNLILDFVWYFGFCCFFVLCVCCLWWIDFLSRMSPVPSMWCMLGQAAVTMTLGDSEQMNENIMNEKGDP